MCWGSRMSIDKPEKISVVHFLSICIRISEVELPNLFLNTTFLLWKVMLTLLLRVFVGLIFQANEKLYYFSENLLLALVKCRILTTLYLFFPGCSLLWIANFESWRKGRVWFLLSVRSLQPLIGRLSKR